ncbi:MAG: TPM domain-containing protein [Clostridia bacterium]|nr:TPM domain-containing protein [Clostridia bacterium]
MTKRIASLLLLLCLTLGCACAEPRYPARTGETTDTAAVLSHTTLEDLRTLDSRLDKADALRLRLATVDFLDGAHADDYAEALFERWLLDDDEILLLMAVGEDRYAFATGEDVDRLLASATITKLLAGSFEEPFMNQQYDQAVADFVPALVREINKVCGTSVNTNGLFGRSSTGLFNNWASSLRQSSSGSETSLLTREDDRTGFSMLKVVLIIAVLLIVFGRFRKSSKNAAGAHRPGHGNRPGPNRRAPYGRGHRR